MIDIQPLCAVLSHRWRKKLDDAFIEAVTNIEGRPPDLSDAGSGNMLHYPDGHVEVEWKGEIIMKFPGFMEFFNNGLLDE